MAHRVRDDALDAIASRLQALRMVERRCAMTKVVRLVMSRSRASRMRCSVSSRGGGFVEDEYGCVLEQCAGDGESLALSARRRGAAFAEAVGSRSMNSVALAAVAAASTSLRVSWGRS
jgi:hypothetical protein